MNKQEINNVLQQILVTHETWAEQGQVLIDGINLDRLMEPVKLDECEFSIWNKSNKQHIVAFSWYKELVHDHDALHNEFSDLLYDAMRKYNPKRRDDLLEEYKAFEADLSEFNNTINKINKDLWEMSDDDFSEMVLKSNEQLKEKDEKTKFNDDSNKTYNDNNLVNKSKSHDDQIQTIDIIEFDEDESTAKHSIVTLVDQGDEKTVTTNKFISEFKAITKDINSSDNIKKHILLKEQNLKQLKQEKELSLQELSHLEQTQKLTKQGLDQLQQHIELKKQEIELEQLDNNKLLELNTKARDKTKEQLHIIEENTVSLNNTVADLEQQNAEDQIKLEADQQTQSIEKQFEMLKSNKTQDIERLQDQLRNRRSELTKLQEQLRLAEEEISEMEQDIDTKQRGISDLEEKERIKNKERSAKFDEQENVIERRVTSIKSKLKEFDVLSIDVETTKNELEDFNQHIQTMKNGFESAQFNNDNEIKEIELQQQQKHEKLTETQNHKKSKNEEIDLINKRIEAAEDALDELKSELNLTNNESKEEMQKEMA